jgi:hypothetical protein
MILDSVAHAVTYKTQGSNSRKCDEMQRAKKKKFTGEKRSNIVIVIVSQTRSSMLASSLPIQALQTDRIIIVVYPLLSHDNWPSCDLRPIQEFPQPLFAYLERLLRCCIGHAEHGAPEVEGIRHVSCDAKDDEEEEINGVAEDWFY